MAAPPSASSRKGLWTLGSTSELGNDVPVAVPFELRDAGPSESLVLPTKQSVLVLLEHAATELRRLERTSGPSGIHAMGVVAASRAIHLALVELEPVSDR